MALIETRRIEPVDDVDHKKSDTSSETAVICKSPGKLKSLLGEIKPGISVHYLSRGDWSMHDLVMELLKKYSPADVFISTYAIRETPVRQLIMALDSGKIRQIHMILDYRAKVRTPEVFFLAQQKMTSIYLMPIHAKVCVIRTAEASISIIGSSNWTTNPKVEAGVISMSKEIAHFHIDWMTKISKDVAIFKQ